ncbi:helix-turn-helix transcriptional regulator [Vibrio sonorensis]|uniref:helix-turn-helix transcriptional regulator n=1 Tax=Vibrio sonorensis TaxID=1004316 RepID=UPI0008DA3012|nr:helix-turn-helix domain-containing protein [Vibrio sonorensis]
MIDIVERLTSYDSIKGRFDSVDLDGVGQAYIMNCTSEETIHFCDVAPEGLYITLMGKNSAYSASYPELPASRYAFRCIASLVPKQIDKEETVLPKGGHVQVIRMHFPIQHNIAIAMSPYDDDEFFKPFEMYASGWQMPLSGELLKVAQSVWECDFEGQARQLWMQGKVRELLALLMVRKPTQTLADRACALIEQKPNENWSISSLSRALATNDCYLKQAFRQQFNMGVASWIQAYRVQLAKEKLSQPNKPITQIALDLGYQNSSYFAKVFKQHVGETPKSYRNRQFSRSEHLNS